MSKTKTAPSPIIEDNKKSGLGDLIQQSAQKWSPAFRTAILLGICTMAVLSRVFSVIRYESIIHEFDPWFNYRTTRYLVEEGSYSLWNWFDHESWYPIGRRVGMTLYPGLMMTSGFIYETLKKVGFPVDIRNVCVFIGPIFAAFTAIVTYLLTKEVTRKSGAGLFAALFVSIIPSYISRSVAGSYDNEAVAIFALVWTFYAYLKSTRTVTSHQDFMLTNVFCIGLHFRLLLRVFSLLLYGVSLGWLCFHHQYHPNLCSFSTHCRQI